MTKVISFRAVRPANGYESKVAALPYDVMTSDEAREMVQGKPHSFLHIDKAEIDLPPSVDLYDDSVYAKARENFDRFLAEGVFIEDAERYYYIYRLTMDGRAQTGLVGCASIDDYLNNKIKKHELTRAEKEKDRIRHVDTLDANTGPIFLTCHPDARLSDAIDRWVAAHEPLFDFVADDGIGHTIWTMSGEACAEIERIFGDIDSLYIADGHHRCASAVKVGLKRREANPDFTGEEEFNFFLSVIFPADQLHILDYNRAVKDLNGYTVEGFLDKMKEGFDVAPWEGDGPYRPEAKHRVGLYLDGRWYKMTAHQDIYDANDPVSCLDVSILQDNVLRPILGIDDPRTDKRIDFIGGIRGLKELEDRVANDMTVAFAMYPTTVDDLMNIADADLIMPPKSTWFEPKLRSGLLIHRLSE
jgi:uncharacterized protein (DUF1015 family)